MKIMEEHKLSQSSFNYVVTVTDEKKNRFYSFAERVREGENLLSVITIPQGSFLHKIIPVKTATEAHNIAEIRNKNAKALGCALFD